MQTHVLIQARQWLFCCGLLTLTATAMADNFTWNQGLDWEVKRDRDGIEVATSAVVDSKFKAVKATMQMQTRLTDLVALVQDVSACPEWADLCKSASIVEQVSATEMFVYTHNDLPWPVSDRDAVAHVVWSQDPTTLAVTMRATLAQDKVAREKGRVRITYGETAWIFTPQRDGNIGIESLAHIDPAGATPAWLTNRLLVDSPYDTLDAMRKIVSSGRYKDHQIEFVTEP